MSNALLVSGTIAGSVALAASVPFLPAVLLTASGWIATICGGLALASVLLPWLWSLIVGHVPNDLKKRYDADWAVVTGGSSGIGRAIAERLASQGINVVVAAIDDRVLQNAVVEMRAAYPAVEFRAVGVNLGGQDGYQQIIDATSSLKVQILFSNAGYIKTGFFTDTDHRALMANYHCNATASIGLCWHFIRQMQLRGLKGCVVLTSSPAGFLPCPFSAMYGATKAFITELGASLAAEVKHDGIDVMVVHPSPAETSFYSGAHSLGAIQFFRSTASGPAVVARKAINLVGRAAICDQGYYPVCVRMLHKLVDVSLLTEIIAHSVHTQGDYKKMRAVSYPNQPARASSGM